MLFKSLIILQFNYSATVWMCHGRGLNNKINNINERGLRTVYQDKKKCSLDTLLKRAKSNLIHMKNLQYLATELYKVRNGFSPEWPFSVFLFCFSRK